MILGERGKKNKNRLKGFPDVTKVKEAGHSHEDPQQDPQHLRRQMLSKQPQAGRDEEMSKSTEVHVPGSGFWPSKAYGAPVHSLSGVPPVHLGAFIWGKFGEQTDKHHS